VKRLCADDSAATSVKVGYRQASYKRKTPCRNAWGFFSSYGFGRVRKIRVTLKAKSGTTSPS
jgi:hypothetical protein